MNNYFSKFIVLFSIIGMLACTASNKDEKQLKLWYDKPASDWMTEALPIGNAYMGAMFFGGIETEQIQFAEATLWAGGPEAHPDYNFGVRKDAWKHLEKIRQLLEEGKLTEAHRMAERQLTGVTHKTADGSMFGDYGAQQTMGDLFVTIGHNGEPENYKREIDLNTGEGRVYYQIDGESHRRHFFGSYPDKVLVYRFESSTPTSYQLKYETPHKKVSDTFNQGLYSFTGEVAGNGMAFETCLKVQSDGEVAFRDGEIQISDARYCNVYHVAATDYLPEFPHYKGADYRGANKATLAGLEGRSYEEIREKHLHDYQNLFSRVQLKLGSSNRDNVPTDVRLKAYAEGMVDAAFEELYFQYSRYLMISGSRPGSMPLNLQGKWNNSTNPPWACDYHMNINQQMLYWPAEVTNLSECHLPLFDYMESLVEPGKISAKEFFNTRGWIVNTMNNPFGFTAPGWGFPWGFFPGGAAWLCQHAWEHYDFTRDKIFLEETAYPLMKEAALFWIDYLIEDENGQLVSSPSYSPEHGGISRGASMDHQMAWDLLNNCIEACNVLGVDEAFKTKAIAVRDKICPPAIGKWGQLQEWKEDVDDPENKHRHVSHLYALHPGKQITVETTPNLAEAAKVSLNARGDDGTGWSLAWKVNFWARLKDGDRAYRLFKRLLRPTGQKGTEMMSGGGSYSNLLCAHPPFQLDGNMGGCAGVAELLLQSHTGTIELLPALPSAWKDGNVKGLKARGGFEVKMEWKENKLFSAQISGKDGTTGTYKYQDTVKEFEIPENGIYTVIL
ncbi:alpha-L-fucosidase 2 [Saccharicrinis carchari]|uniref:Alpha-L-fucosidase 2 n=1 Tax=Saccharicrinis carchari TaxID=1168039 RepID=A0A521BZN3_SACCC|nr:glycoside hydrolase family 95 protein [Saccharicrinis carchari]SMO51930.1 alpha-L-fucosidase 2 [Saccharicrinis carchari]